MTCAVSDCIQPVKARGYCRRHYLRVRRHGSPDVVLPKRVKVPLADRIWPKVDKRGPDDCWIWLGYIEPDGYGRIRNHGGSQLAHRALYELEVGSIPDGLELDHLCRTQACVNPGHLQPVTPRVNRLREWDVRGRVRN